MKEYYLKLKIYVKIDGVSNITYYNYQSVIDFMFKDFFEYTFLKMNILKKKCYQFWLFFLLASSIH